MDKHELSEMSETLKMKNANKMRATKRSGNNAKQRNSDENVAITITMRKSALKSP